jgi:hypothetical protein
MEKALYSVQALQNLQTQLINNAAKKENGQGPEYEVRVDNVIVVPRNRDYSLLENVPDALSSTSKQIKVSVFRGVSNWNDAYLFDLDLSAGQAQGLGSLMGLGNLGLSGPQSLDGIINEKVSQHLAADELTRTKSDLEKAQSRINTLEQQLEELEEQRDRTASNKMIGAFMGSGFGDVAIEFIKNSPLSKTPLGNLLKPMEETHQLPMHDNDIVPLGQTSVLDEDAQRFITWFEQSFPNDRDQVLLILGAFAHDKTLIHQVADLIGVNKA